MFPSDGYDRAREAVLDESEFEPDPPHPWDVRDFSAALAGCSDAWHDLDSEGFPASGR